MNKRKLGRELKTLLDTHKTLISPYHQYFSFADKKTEMIENCKQVVSAGEFSYGRNYLETCINTLRVFELIELLGLSDEEFVQEHLSFITLRRKQTDQYKLKPTKEGRDNKGVYVGSGGTNKNMVRYPSKKRSRKTWKLFYALFPRLAEQDKWDGNSSIKMK